MDPQLIHQTRRQAIAQMGAGFGGMVLSTLLADETVAAPHSLQPRQPHHGAKARAVIQLFMHGGPSHVDLLDPKPVLDRHHGQRPPGEVADDEERTTYLLKGAFPFQRFGESGLPMAAIMPHVGRHADKIAVIRSMFGEHRNHEQSIWLANTGLIRAGRPNIGSWAVYGLGTENRNLPGYVALPDPNGLPVDGHRNWSSGWLPPLYQGTPIRSQGSPILHLKPSKPLPKGAGSARFALLQKLNKNHRRNRPGELELDARIASFELAARMQLTATNALDVNQETAATHKLYGLDKPQTASYGKRCLMARRLIERGVRYVQIFMKGQPWDTHSSNKAGLIKCCGETDLPVGGLLTDLQQRGLLDSTLVQWGGEFGRTPAAEQRNGNNKSGNEGRDHHPYGFSVWLAGGGIRGGQAYGATDDFGYRSIVDRCQTADLHATILHQLGLNHEELTYSHNGRDERLTDVYKARVIKPLIA